MEFSEEIENRQLPVDGQWQWTELTISTPRISEMNLFPDKNSASV